MHNPMILKATCHQIIRKAIRNSGFLDDVSDNRLGAIISNNLDMILPETLTFKNKSPLAIAVEHFTVAAGDDPTEKNIRDLINDRYSAIATDTIESVVGAFQQKLANAKKELTLVHDEGLKFLEKYNLALAKYERPAKDSMLQEAVLTYESWAMTASVGAERTLISEVNASFRSDDEEPSLNAYSSFINGVKLRFIEKEANNAMVILPEEKRTAIVNNISSTSGLGLKACGNYLDIILSKSGINSLISDLERLVTAHRGEVIKSVGDTLLAMQKFLKGYDAVVLAQTNPETLLDTSNQTVQANIELFREVQKGFAYYLCYLRYSYFNKVLILPNGSINNDVKDAALSTGLTKDDMRIALHFKEHEHPGAHITTDYLMNIKGRLDHMFKGAIEHADTMRVVDHKKNVRAAFDDAVRLIAKHNENVVYDSRAASIAEEVGNSGLSPQLGFVKLFNNLQPLTVTLMEEFSKGYTALESEAGCENVTNRNLQEVQAVVLTKQIANFIKENFCKA